MPQPVEAVSAAVVTPIPTPARPAAADPSPDKMVTAEMVESARKSNKLEGVGGAKLGVAKVNARDVSLLNGGSIRIGERFPSGERLLALDPENGQIITDKRTLLVF